MSKKTRNLKKHYRGVERDLRDFNIDMSKESWYGMWHIHLDWDGTTSRCNKHRKIHILYYLKIFDKIDNQTNGSNREFQTWIYLDGYDGVDDAIYFHTENPECDFPYRLDNVEWNVEIPSMLKNLLDLSNFNIGRLKGEKENKYSYIIQRKGLGLRINKE